MAKIPRLGRSRIISRRGARCTLLVRYPRSHEAMALLMAPSPVCIEPIALHMKTIDIHWIEMKF